MLMEGGGFATCQAPSELRALGWAVGRVVSTVLILRGLIPGSTCRHRPQKL